MILSSTSSQAIAQARKLPCIVVEETCYDLDVRSLGCVFERPSDTINGQMVLASECIFVNFFKIALIAQDCSIRVMHCLER